MYVGICEEEEKGKEKEMRVVYEGGFGYYQPNFNVSPILTSARSWRDINGYGRSLCFRHFFYMHTIPVVDSQTAYSFLQTCLFAFDAVKNRDEHYINGFITVLVDSLFCSVCAKQKQCRSFFFLVSPCTSPLQIPSS